MTDAYGHYDAADFGLHAVTDQPAPAKRECDALCRDVEEDRDRLAAEVDALDNRVRLLLIRPDGDRQDHETITVAELRNAINGDPAPVPGSSRRAPERRSLDEIYATGTPESDALVAETRALMDSRRAQETTAQACICGTGVHGLHPRCPVHRDDHERAVQAIIAAERRAQEPVPGDDVEQVIVSALVDRHVEIEGPDFDQADENLIAYARAVHVALERAGLLAGSPRRASKPGDRVVDGGVMGTIAVATDETVTVECTGLSAAWCPAHGDCACPGEPEAEGRIQKSLNDPRCPLHSPTSSHADRAA